MTSPGSSRHAAAGEVDRSRPQAGDPSDAAGRIRVFSRPHHLTFAATDLSNFLGCSHLALLDRAAKQGGPKPPKYDDPALEVLQQRGIEHEQAYEAQLRGRGLNVVRVDEPSRALPRHDYWERYTAATLELMRRGVDVVVQGGLWDGQWVGKPDFLLRVDARSTSDWTYDVVDTKLAREAKGGALLQVLLYADLVERVYGAAPQHVHLALGGPAAHTESFRVAEYAAYYRTARNRFLAFQHDASQSIPRGPEPVPHCDVCAWKSRCAEERRDLDHLSLVAGISGRQRTALQERGVRTLKELGRLPLPLTPALDGVSGASLERVREQARIQLEGRVAGEPRYELLPPVDAQGLAALPEPSPGDLFFDLEGNPYAYTHGIEYLFGFTDTAGEYQATWALTRADEKRVFEEFIDFVIRRLDEFPDLHIYHFAPYEPTAFKRLMGFHATREAEVDRLLRGGVFVDLHRIVRQGVRASVESYSIKKLEPFYGYRRDVDLRDASTALARFDAWLEMGLFDERSTDVMAAVEQYNRDDCVSTLRLREWLETLRRELEAKSGTPLSRPPASDGAPAEALEERRAEIAARMGALTADVPVDPDERSHAQQARWLLAQLLEFHRRENKATWWEYFRCSELSAEEMIEDRATLGGLEYVGVIGTEKKSEVHHYRFPPQDHAVRGKVRDPMTGAEPGDIVAIDDSAGTVDIKRGRTSRKPHPPALVPFDLIGDTVLRDSILRVADRVIAQGLDAMSEAVADLLCRRPPRLRNGRQAKLMADGEAPLDAACRLVGELDSTILPIQGPPGAGKTYTGARMILEAIRAGLRVGVTATSHKVISNLLAEVCSEARATGTGVKGVQKGKPDQSCGEQEVEATEDNKRVRQALDSGEANLAAGTAWLWAREEMQASVDLLFVDEAGQFSLANTVAVAPAAGSLVLLGDPRQLEQPQQGVHPLGADVSALDHLLGGAATVAADRGLFLEKTYRLHPTITAFTSEIFYEGRLESHAGLERQALNGREPLAGTGLRIVPVDHAGNQSESAEEVEVVEALVEALTTRYAWTDEKGVARPLQLNDVLVVAPYNAQVAAIARRLPDGARVGTVDKFQGQEAPVVIYSMATSTPADAPRGMEFLYSPNRLNVATSRARCLAVVVASPELFTPNCRTPRQMQLANAFCRFRELATEVPAFAACSRGGIRP
jgi:predicted RecB family nuclease